MLYRSVFYIVATMCILHITVYQVQAQFGKNKVQYQKFEWKYISSKHFDVYYHQGLKYVAEFCAVKSEQALSSITNNFSFRITKRINVIVYGSHNEFQQTNVISEFLPEGVGGVTELFKNRMVVPFEGDWEKFRHVIHHELVHAYINEVFYGGNIQTAIQSKVQIPIWMNEGLAEYESLGGLDVATDMFMRDITLSESLPSLERMGGYFAYRGGQAFYAYVADKYGRAKVTELLSRLKTAPDPVSLFRGVFGLDIEEFSEQWQNDMKKKYFPDVDKFKRLDDFAKRLTNHAKDDNTYNTSPSISPDGKRVAFISDRDEEFGIYVMDIERKSEPVKLVSSQRALNFEELNILTPGISWNPKGDKLAVTAKAGGEDALFIVDAASGSYDKQNFGLKLMTSAAWSPDGKWIAVSATSLEQPDIYLYNVATKKISRLTSDVFSDANPTWSPDSKFIYFISERGDRLGANCSKDSIKIWRHQFSMSNVYRIEISSKKIEQLTSDFENKKTSIAVSADGTKLLYVSDQNGIGNLYEMNLATRAIRPKTNSMSGLSQIALSRDETKLLFAAQNKGGFDLFMIRNPLDRFLESDTLPLTKLKLKMLAVKNSTTRESAVDSVTTTSAAPVGYGSFDVDFTRDRSFRGQTADQGDEASRIERLPDADTVDSFTERDYKVTITNDLIYGGTGYSSLWNTAQLQIQGLFSDLMGDHVIYASLALWNDLRNSNVLFQYGYNPQIIDYTFTAYHNALLWSYSYSPDYFSLRNYGASMEGLYALSRFQRVEAGLGFMGITRANETTPSSDSLDVSRFFLLPSVRYVFDNSQNGFFAPYKGTRLFVNLQMSPITKRFATFTTDLRTYLPVYKYFYGFMARFSAGASLGADPRSFFLGGTDNWINRSVALATSNTQLFSEPEDFAFFQLVSPLRGFDLAQLQGSKYFVSNVEFRFPLFQGFVAVPIPFVLLGNIFADLGTAWSGSESSIAFRKPEYVQATDLNFYPVYSEGTLLFSTGIGVRTVLAGLPLKIDVAWRNDGSNWSEPNYLFSLGFDL